MSKPSFNLLLNLLSPSLESALPTIPPNYSLAAALFRLAHGASYKAVARRFRIDSAEACRAFYLVCKEVNDKLGHLFEFSSDLETIVMGFGWNSLPNCFGVLGLAKFGIDGELLGKDGSLMVQALVGSEGRFLDVSAGWPSTMKPQTILLQSKLYLEVEKSKELLNGPSIENDGHLIPRYILGDSYFPLLTWLLTPYNRLNEEDSFSSLERAFNSVHDNAIGIVRIAFQRLRARWQLLAKQWKEECVEFLPFVIVTGCLLHNFLIKCGEPMPDKNTGHVKEVDLPVFDGDVDENAQRIRDILAMHLSQWRSRKIALPS
ncbi:Harbinger transposase-derived nuclease [Quillaja saponaria]|uniref:Harbinger transposase-derived nuclease n=1 Tax=Quillaja saponaria TaxID=32244 RepID=A0AAD7LFW6_QUISA|nr:Harbinger transposase-derived nuclease [Quillaja saponaria]